MVGEQALEERRAVWTVEDPRDRLVVGGGVFGLATKILLGPRVPELRAPGTPARERLAVELRAWCRWLTRWTPAGSAPRRQPVRPAYDSPCGIVIVSHPRGFSVRSGTTLPWWASQARVSAVMSVAPPSAHSVMWWTWHRVAGASHPGAVQPFSAPYRAIR